MEVRFLGREDPLEKEMATHSSILAWRIPGDGLTDYSPRGRTESDMTEQEHTHIITHPSHAWSQLVIRSGQSQKGNHHGRLEGATPKMQG